MIGELALAPGQPWLDLRDVEVIQHLRTELAPMLQAFGLTDFDLSDVTSRARSLTQSLARWAFEHGYHGIVCPSRFHYAHSYWALFEGRVLFAPVRLAAVLGDDSDLILAGRLLGL